MYAGLLSINESGLISDSYCTVCDCEFSVQGLIQLGLKLFTLTLLMVHTCDAEHLDLLKCVCRIYSSVRSAAVNGLT